jgi:hypothetical protein
MKKINLSSSLIIFLLFTTQITWSTTTLALDEAALAKYREDAKISATKMLPEVDSYFHDSLKTKDIQTTMGYETDSPVGTDMPIQEAEMHGARLQEAGPDKENPDYKYQCNKKNCEVGHTLSSGAMLNRQEEIDNAMIIRDEKGNIIGHKAFVDNILDNQKKAESAFAGINGSQAACTPITENLTKTTPDTCDSYYDYVTNTCYPQQVVEIDPKFNYSCSKKREIKEKICEDIITKIACKPSSKANCFTAGLFSDQSNRELIQASGGLRLIDSQKDGHTILELGNDKHWTYDAGRNGCAIKEFNAKFYIKNAKTVSIFALLEVFENNLLHIAVNGHTIYNGLGGNDLSLGGGGGSDMTVYSGNGGQGTCGINAQHTHWKPYYYDIRAAGILRDGENEIKIKLVYHWKGHAGFKIAANSYCCNEFDIEREEKCEYR